MKSTQRHSRGPITAPIYLCWPSATRVFTSKAKGMPACSWLPTRCGQPSLPGGDLSQFETSSLAVAEKPPRLSPAKACFRGWTYWFKSTSQAKRKPTTHSTIGTVFLPLLGELIAVFLPFWFIFTSPEVQNGCLQQPHNCKVWLSCWLSGQDASALLTACLVHLLGWKEVNAPVIHLSTKHLKHRKASLTPSFPTRRAYAELKAVFHSFQLKIAAPSQLPRLACAIPQTLWFLRNYSQLLMSFSTLELLTQAARFVSLLLDSGINLHEASVSQGHC